MIGNKSGGDSPLDQYRSCCALPFWVKDSELGRLLSTKQTLCQVFDLRKLHAARVMLWMENS